MKTYTKPVLTYKQQIELLKDRGLKINDEARVTRHLKNVSYYRLSAYMLPFKETDFTGNIIDAFKPGTTWDDIYNTYKFDRKLRLLIFDAIERIEIALRSQLIYQLSHKYGSHWQDNKGIFKPAKFDHKNGRIYDVFADVQGHIKEQLNANQKVTFIKHYISEYDNPKNPPSWMSVELLYFSELSKICQNLNARQDRMDIAKSFGMVDDNIFCSWLHTLNYIRNICAHHSRLWNITLDITPSKYCDKSGKLWLSNKEVLYAQTSKLYYSICLILFLLQTVNPKSKFKQHFFDLLKEYPVVNEGYMGFPNGWISHPIWQDSANQENK